MDLMRWRFLLLSQARRELQKLIGGMPQTSLLPHMQRHNQRVLAQLSRLHEEQLAAAEVTTNPELPAEPGSSVSDTNSSNSFIYRRLGLPAPLSQTPPPQAESDEEELANRRRSRWRPKTMAQEQEAEKIRRLREVTLSSRKEHAARIKEALQERQEKERAAQHEVLVMASRKRSNRPPR